MSELLSLPLRLLSRRADSFFCSLASFFSLSSFIFFFFSMYSAISLGCCLRHSSSVWPVAFLWTEQCLSPSAAGDDFPSAAIAALLMGMNALICTFSPAISVRRIITRISTVVYRAAGP